MHPLKTVQRTQMNEEINRDKNTPEGEKNSAFFLYKIPYSAHYLSLLVEPDFPAKLLGKMQYKR